MLKHIDKTDILKYAAGILTDKDRTAVERHIAGCDICLLKITHAMKKKKEACDAARVLFRDYSESKLDWDSTEFVKSHLIICDNCVGKYHAFLEEKETRQHDITIKNIRELPPSHDLASMKTFEFAKKDLNIGMSGSSRHGIMVQLQSDKYDVSGVKVSLGKSSKTGFDAFLTAFTSNKGTAKLGKSKSALARKEKKYSLHISGLKKKSFKEKGK